jgi:hypothetical protein
MSDLEQSLDAGSSVDTGGASEGISVSEGAAQLVSEREVTPTETPPAIRPTPAEAYRLPPHLNAREQAALMLKRTVGNKHLTSIGH